MSPNESAELTGFSSDELELLDLLLREEGVALPDRPTIPPRDRDDHLPLSFAQERLWFIDQWDPGNPAYNIPATVRLRGRLDLTALRWSIARVVGRHEALRTTFPTIEGQPFQAIGPRGLRPLPLLDFVALPHDRREGAALDLAQAEVRFAFDLARGALLRATLLRLAADEHILILVMHHIIFDGWSVGLFIKELASCYAGRALGRPAQLPDLPIQYADFAIWQRGWLQGEVLERHLDYWRAQLRPPLPVLALPTDRPRPPVQRFRGANQMAELPQPLFEALSAISQRDGSTLFMILLAAFDVLLARYSGQSDLIIGSPIANRDMVEIESLIGYFVNTLLLRARISRRMTFRALLDQVREATLDAYAHQSVPFEHLVNLLRPERDPSHTPLFQVMFVFQNITPPEYSFPGLDLSYVGVGTRTAKFDLLLGFGETETGISGGIEYNTDLFDDATIARMLARYQLLLEAIAADLDQPIADLPLLADAEREQILVAWNATARDYPQDLLLHQLVEAQAARTPDAVAVMFDPLADGVAPASQPQQLSYGELERRANQLARHLRRMGVGPEARVAIKLDRSIELIVALLGVLKAGAAYVPIDPAYPPERIAFMLEDSQARAILTKDERRKTNDAAEQAPDQIVDRTSKIVHLDADWPAIAQLPATPPSHGAYPGNLAYVIYTSGSTGTPKGALIAHAGVVNYTLAARERYELRASDRALQFASISFDTSAEEIYPALCCGAALVLRNEATLAAPDAFFRLCRMWALTVLDLPTAYWHDLSAALRSGAAELPLSIRLVIIGGEQALRERAALPLRPGAATARLLNTYGPTEATIVASAWEIPAGPPPEREIPIGRPIANVRLYVCDPSMQPQPIGVAGDLYIGGPGLARGYLGRPGQTAAAFVPNPFAQGSGVWGLGSGGRGQRADPEPQTRNPEPRLYRTGDLARYRADGAVEYLGRIDGQIKLRGYRIEPDEIAALLRKHPQVRESAVLLREDAPGDKRLVAYVVASDELHGKSNEVQGTSNEQLRSSPDSSLGSDSSLAADLRVFLAARLPAYMIPSAFVALDALPRTPSGKLDRQALPAPEPAQPSTEHPAAAPQTPTERDLAAIWSEVLRVDPVGLHDNFFDLGGHSLLVTQVISRVQARLGIALKVRDLFAAPTIARLAELVDAAALARMGADGAALVSDSEQDALIIPRRDPDVPAPLSFIQQRIWFLDQLDPGSLAFNMPAVLQLDGELDVAALQRAFAALARRHETLRTAFPLHHGQPVQHIAPPRPLPLPLLDLAVLPSPARAALAPALVTAFLARPFALATGPLIRLALCRRAARQHLLLIALHHSIADGWSIGVLIRDLQAAYAAARARAPLALPPLPIQYADFAAWQRAWLRGPVRDQLLAFWRAQLTPLPPPLALPTDRPHPPTQSSAGALRPLALPAPLSAALHALARRSDATLFMTLLAAFAALLARLADQHDLAIGTPVAGRDRLQTEPLIGCFLTTLPLRLRPDPAASFLDLLAQARQTSLAAFAHQQLPFEQLVAALQPQRDPRRPPLFQVMLILQTAPQPALAVADLTLTPLPFRSASALYELTLSLTPTPHGLVGGIEYATALFDPSTIARLAAQFQTLLAAVLAAPTRPLHTLDLLSPAARQQILREWTDTARAHATPDLPTLFAAQVARSPDAVALRQERADGVVAQLSYAALARQTYRLAHALRARGVAAGTVLAVGLARGAASLAALLATLARGAVYLPLDLALPPTRLATLRAAGGARLLLTRASDAGAASLAAGGWADPARGAVLDLDDVAAAADLARQPATPPAVAPRDPDAPAYLIFTSGSSGEPKGVVVPARQLRNRLAWMWQAYPFGARELSAHKTALGFVDALWEQLGPLLAGSPLLAIDAGTVLDLARLVRVLRRHAVSRLWLTPTLLDALLGATDGRLGAALPDLRMWVSSGEALSADLAARFAAAAPGARLLNLYGTSEVFDATIAVVDALRDAAAGRPAIGRAIWNVTTYVLDRWGQPVGIGVAGELVVGGVGLAQGYLARPDLTAAAFVPNPFGARADLAARRPDLRRYRTGDRARYRADGQLELLGRADRQIKLRGVRVELGEVEAALRRQAGVAAAAVVAAPDARGAATALVGYVVPAAETARAGDWSAALRRELAGELAAGTTPQAIVALADLPQTASGKLDRRALAARAAADLAGTAGAMAGGADPRPGTEATLAAVWAELLGRPEVRRTDEFFALGGHSLLATLLLGRVRATLGVELPLRSVFELPTLADMAARIDAFRLAEQYVRAAPGDYADDEEQEEGEL